MVNLYGYTVQGSIHSILREVAVLELVTRLAIRYTPSMVVDTTMVTSYQLGSYKRSDSSSTYLLAYSVLDLCMKSQILKSQIHDESTLGE